MYVSENGVSINYSLARSFYNDHRSTTFNSFLGSWSVFSLASQTERTIGSHGDRLRLARSNLPEMRSGNRAETPSVRHERGKSWRRTPEGMFVRLAAITGYPRRLYSIVYIDVDSPFHVPSHSSQQKEKRRWLRFTFEFWGGKTTCPLQRRHHIFCPTGIALSNFGACH